MNAKKKGTVRSDLQTPVIPGFVITLDITPPDHKCEENNVRQTNERSPRMRHFARIPRVASSREAAQSQSSRWLIDVLSFLKQ